MRSAHILAIFSKNFGHQPNRYFIHFSTAVWYSSTISVKTVTKVEITEMLASYVNKIP